MKPRRLASIDILRGIAALSVVVYHATDGELFLDQARIAPWLTMVAIPAAIGFSGVYLFFVISGFCIHLAWARAAAGGNTPHIDFFAFWKRRIRRLYPPYVVALGLCLVVLAAEGRLFSGQRPLAWDVGLHLLMLHNLDPATAWSINTVFWTLAIEEQLYLAYFLLLPLRRRFGWPFTLGLCLAARLLWFGLAFGLHRAAGIGICVTEAAAAHWFVWALGAWGVEAWYGLVELPQWSRSFRVGAAALLAAAGLNFASRLIPPASALGHLGWLVEQPLWGLGFFVVVNRAVSAERGPGPVAPWSFGSARRAVLWLSRALGGVGVFSYSLYLVHMIVLSHLSRLVLRSTSWNASTGTAFRLLVLTPLAVAFAWAFFILFERPFLSTASGREPEHEPHRDGTGAEAIRS